MFFHNCHGMPMLCVDHSLPLNNTALSPLSMERVLERFRRRFCLRVFRAERALLLKKNASTMNIARVSMGADCCAD